MAGCRAGVRMGDAEFSFRDNESEVLTKQPCEDGRLDLGYLSLKRERRGRNQGWR